MDKNVILDNKRQRPRDKDRGTKAIHGRAIDKKQKWQGEK
jgi:hypothetical protein